MKIIVLDDVEKLDDIKDALECYARDCADSPKYYINEPGFGNVLVCETHKRKYWGERR